MSDSFIDLGNWHAVARRCGASKAEHTYMPHYEKLLGHYVDMPLNILEIGVCNGGSIKTWMELFPRGMIYGVDVKNDTRWPSNAYAPEEPVRIDLCDQSDPRLVTLYPPESLDVVIDDGSHAFSDQTRARESLWPALKPGGFYFIEDILDLRDLRYWASFARFKMFSSFMRRLDGVTPSYDDVLVVLRKEPCPPAWEW